MTKGEIPIHRHHPFPGGTVRKKQFDGGDCVCPRTH